MKEKYIKASSIAKIIDKLNIEALGQWDLDDAFVCRRILQEIKDMKGIYVDPKTKTVIEGI